MKIFLKKTLDLFNKYKAMPLMGGIILVLCYIIKALGCLFVGVCML